MNYNVVRVKNVTNKDFEFRFNGQVFQCPAGKFVNFPEDAARHGVKKSICRIDPYTGKGERRLVIEGEGDTDVEIEGKNDDDELIDREAMGDTKATKVNLSRAQMARPVAVGEN